MLEGEDWVLEGRNVLGSGGEGMCGALGGLLKGDVGSTLPVRFSHSNPCSFQVLSHLILITGLLGMFYNYPSIANLETEAQRYIFC